MSKLVTFTVPLSPGKRRVLVQDDVEVVVQVRGAEEPEAADQCEPFDLFGRQAAAADARRQGSILCTPISPATPSSGVGSSSMSSSGSWRTILSTHTS
jgi:hypothetical protein